MKEISVLGIDLAKNSFQLHGLDSAGKTVFKKSMSPRQANVFIANLKPCRVAMEACGGSHFYARKYSSFGHDAKIIAPQYVKPFVKGNRNDPSDAQGIAEAASRPSMRFVPVKSEESQDVQNYHRIRDRLIGNRVALTNQIRGILYEYGITIKKGDSALRKELVEICKNDSLSKRLRMQMAYLYEEMKEIQDKIDDIEKELLKIVKENETCKRLMTIPGVGPLTATAVLPIASQVHEFKNSRQMAAYLGLVPGHRQTGGPKGKKVMLGITKRGDRYLRKLIVQGARCYLIAAKRRGDKTSLWATGLKEKRCFNVAAVALANKNARIMWAIMSRQETYKVAA